MQEAAEMLRQYVGDMLALERQAREAVQRQLEDERVRAWPETTELLRRVEYRLAEHAAALEGHMALTGGDAQSALKKAAGVMLGAAAGLYDRLRGEDPVSRVLRDDYVVLNLAAASYSMLHATALAARSARVADLSLEHLMDLTPLIVELSRLIPRLVTRELAGEDKPVDPALGEQAARNVERAWSGDVVGY